MLAVIDSDTARGSFPEAYWPVYQPNVTRSLGRASSKLPVHPGASAAVEVPARTGNLLVQFDFSCDGNRPSLQQLTPGSGHRFAPGSSPRVDALGRHFGALVTPHELVEVAASDAADPTSSQVWSHPVEASEQSTWPRLPFGAVLPTNGIRSAAPESYVDYWDSVVAGSRGLIRSTIVDGQLAGSITKTAITASLFNGAIELR